MANKAYIVANKQQEHEVLDKLEREGMTWSIINEKPTENKPSNWFKISIFPYIIFVEKNTVAWNFISRLEDEEIVYDGRKEEQMSEKYIVSQEFMDELENSVAQGRFVSVGMLSDLPYIINNWRITRENNESNNRLSAIIRWVNGEDVFEVEKPNKWVVRSKDKDVDGDYSYVQVGDHNTTIIRYHLDSATRFDTKEEAQEWANSHQEVVEVGE